MTHDSADPLAIVASTADAAFAVDEEGRVVIWNRGAERLLGYSASRVLGKPCHDILCGRDVFGNRFCNDECALHQMVVRHEPVRRFEVDVRRESGQLRRVAISIVVVPGPRPSQFTMIHLLQAVEAAAEPGLVTLSHRTAASPAGPGAAGSAPPPQLRSLTERELQVLRLVADGAASREIADSLFISVTTVRNHIQNILRKLEVHSKLEAVSLALRNRAI